MEIADLLAIDLNQEIEAVVKVGDYDEQSATQEIKNYIVTDKIADYIDKFIRAYKNREKETGVWVSGFYGSGKSYLAKMIGYLLENPVLSGVEARELFKSRLVGLDDRYLLEGEIESLDQYNTKVVTFDLSGESTVNSLFAKLLLNFLDSIGLSKDIWGYTEYQIMKTEDYDEFLDKANEFSGDWTKARHNSLKAPQTIRKVWSEISNQTEEEIDNITDKMDNKLKTLDADSLVKELDAFIEMDNDYDRIMFIVDEVSEAIDKDHVDISELRGVAQHLSENGQGKYWFLATAQEKLDNVLSKKNINQNDINIITDRFQLKIHLSSAQVDKVTKERLLAKTEEGREKLREFYNDNSGKINNLSNLSGKFSTTIDSPEEFIDQYPFFNYQMRLLKNFLFAVFQQAKSGGSERGMLVTVDRILKEEKLPDKELGKFVTSYQLAEHGFPMPQSELVDKFNQAQNDLVDEGSSIDGRKLMQVIFFLEKSDDLKRTVDNITKAYSNDLTYIGDIKPEIEEALELLEEKNFVLEESGEYKITSDTEKKLMEEMTRQDASWEERKSIIKDKIKDFSFISQVGTVKLEGKSYNVAIRDEENTLLSRHKGEVCLRVYNVLDVDSDVDSFLETKREEYLQKDEAVIIPNPSKREDIDKLVRRIYQYRQIVKQHRNSTEDEIKDVIDSFSTILTNKEDELERVLRNSYEDGWLIYDYQEQELDSDNLLSTITEVESKMIDRTFDKRLGSSLSRDVALNFLSVDQGKLVNYCGDDQFKFFDADGTFIGDSLRVVDGITKECQDRSGSTGSGLLKKFEQKPYGWEYGDIAATMAALLRAGSLKIKYEGQVYRDYRDAKVKKIFESVNRFKKAKFNVITGGLSPSLKQEVVDTILDADIRGKIEVNYGDNDYQVVDAITKVADSYFSKFKRLKDQLESGIVDQDRNDIKVLKNFIRRVDDSNLKTEADEFIANRADFTAAIEYIIDLDRFYNHDYQKYLDQTKFVKEVEVQIEYLPSKKDIKEEIEEKIDHYNHLKDKSIIENIDQLQELYQEIRQKFNQVMKKHHNELENRSKNLLEVAQDKQEEIEQKSIKENRDLYDEVSNYIKTCRRFLDGEFKLSQKEAKCTHCNSTLREITQSIELYENRINHIKNAPVVEPVPKSGGNGGGETRETELVLELTLPKETASASQLKQDLQDALDRIDSNQYSKFKINLK